MTKLPDPYLVDDDNPELSHDEILAMKPASEVLPPDVYAKLVADHEAWLQTKQAMTLTLDRDLVDRLNAQGGDWRGRANALLRKAVGL